MLASISVLIESWVRPCSGLGGKLIVQVYLSQAWCPRCMAMWSLPKWLTWASQFLLRETVWVLLNVWQWEKLKLNYYQVIMLDFIFGYVAA